MNHLNCQFCVGGALHKQPRCMHIATPRQRVAYLTEEVAVSKEMLRHADPHQLERAPEYLAWYKRAVWNLGRSEVQLLQAMREIEGLPPLEIAV